MKASLHAIELHNIDQFNLNIVYFIGLVFIYFITSWLLRIVDWPGLYHNLEKWIYRKYIPCIIQLDNNYVENIGTGKMISILRDGRTIWIDQLSSFLKESMKIFVTGGFLIYLISQIRIEYALGMIL